MGLRDKAGVPGQPRAAGRLACPGDSAVIVVPARLLPPRIDRSG